MHRSPKWNVPGEIWSEPSRAWHRVEADDADLRTALFRRVEDYLRTAIARLDRTGLMEAVSAATPGDTIVRVLATIPERETEADPFSEALLRGAAIKKEAVQAAGGLLSSGDVAKLLGITIPAVKQRQRRGKLLGVPTSSGEWGYPARQFSPDGRVHDGLPEVLAAFPAETSPWVVLGFLANPVPGDEQGVAFDALSTPPDVARLVEVARSYGEQGAT
jgi:hypothetical protein